MAGVADMYKTMWPKKIIGALFLFVSFLVVSCEMKVTVTPKESQTVPPEDQLLRDGGTYVRRGGLEAKVNVEEIAHREQLSNGAEISVMISTNGAIVR